MPELPEVETVVRSLSLTIKAATTTAIRFNRQDLRDRIPIPLVKKILLNQRILDIHRRAKYIICSTTKGSVIFHLGMSGSMLVLPTAEEQYPHTHVVFGLRMANKEHSYLHFIDPRRFGRIGASLNANLSLHHFFTKLGPEPLGKEDIGRHLYERGRNSKRPIKTLVMDASILVGVGNIYACESLFDAKIKPGRLACDVTKIEYRNLAASIRKILEKAISFGGTTLKDFKNLEGKPGYFAIELSVYGRNDQLCHLCARPIKAIKMGGRGTWFCNYCQK